MRDHAGHRDAEAERGVHRLGDAAGEGLLAGAGVGDAVERAERVDGPRMVPRRPKSVAMLASDQGS